MCSRRNKARGFTLIELMIVVAIMSVLSAIALPMYRDYVIRSRMAEPLDALAEAKVSLSEYVAATRRYPSDARYLAINFSDRDSDVLHSLSWSPDSPQNGESVYLTAEIYASVIEGGPKDSTNLLAFQLSGSTNADWSMTWDCLPGYGASGERAVPIKYLPSTCSG